MVSAARGKKAHSSEREPFLFRKIKGCGYGRNINEMCCHVALIFWTMTLVCCARSRETVDAF